MKQSIQTFLGSLLPGQGCPSQGSVELLTDGVTRATSLPKVSCHNLRAEFHDQNLEYIFIKKQPGGFSATSSPARRALRSPGLAKRGPPLAMRTEVSHALSAYSDYTHPELCVAAVYKDEKFQSHKKQLQNVTASRAY